MKMYSILFISLLSMQLLTACDDNENNPPLPPVEEEVSYPNRYYIDPENGAYYNTGHSPSQAWESMDRFTERTWGPGDTILIKRGTVYEGQLVLKGNGAPGKPIVLGSYGDESLPLPEIRTGGKKPESILIRNVEYWEIHDFKVTNKGEEPVAKIVGIQLTAENIPGGVMNHIHIKRCIIEDVYGTLTHNIGGGGAGLFFYNIINSPTPSSFNDILVEDCQFINIQRDGIIAYIASGDRDMRKANTNYVIRGNTFEGIPGDQIVVIGCDGAIVEHNIVRKCAMGGFSPEGSDFRAEASAAIWNIHSDNTIFRYNIVQDMKATWDGQAFDCDQNCVNTLFEYNISYNNVGGFFLLCPLDAYFDKGYAEHSGTIVRYNISINDGLRDYVKENGDIHAPSIDISGRVKDAHFYNNTIIKTKTATENMDNTAIAFADYMNLPKSLTFSNNIFYNTTGVANPFYRVASGEFKENVGVVMQNNLIYGYSNELPGTGEYNTGNINADPQFVRLIEDFVKNNDLIDKQEILDGLKLATGSPCTGAGAAVNDGGFFPITNDFWGSPVGNNKNIGAYNH